MLVSLSSFPADLISIAHLLALSLREVRSGCWGYEASWMVVATIIGCGQVSLAVNGASKFSAPHDECIIQKSPLFQVSQQGCRGLVCLLATGCAISGKAGVMVGE